MFPHFLFFDFHNLLNENIKTWCVLNIRCFLMFFLGSYSSLNHKNTPCFTNRCTRMSAHHLRDLQCKRASRSMHSQVYVFGCFFRCRSWTCPRRFWSPTWPQLEPMLEPCWPLFGTFLGVLLASQLKIAFKTIFCCFLIAFRSSRSSKTLPLSMILRIVAFAS